MNAPRVRTTPPTPLYHENPFRRAVPLCRRVGCHQPVGRIDPSLCDSDARLLALKTRQLQPVAS